MGGCFGMPLFAELQRGLRLCALWYMRTEPFITCRFSSSFLSFLLAASFDIHYASERQVMVARSICLMKIQNFQGQNQNPRKFDKSANFSIICMSIPRQVVDHGWEIAARRSMENKINKRVEALEGLHCLRHTLSILRGINARIMLSHMMCSTVNGALYANSHRADVTSTWANILWIKGCRVARTLCPDVCLGSLLMATVGQSLGVTQINWLSPKSHFSFIHGRCSDASAIMGPSR